MKLAGALPRALAVSACCTLGGCAGAGPAEPVDGTCRLMQSPGASDPATLEVDGSTVRLETAGHTTTWARGAADAEAVLCPPRARGRPVALTSGPVALAGTTFARPALFGDCGVTRPVRVTVVDLDSTTPTGTFGFTRWVEFCDTKDPDG